jgi:hypothetical protein
LKIDDFRLKIAGVCFPQLFQSAITANHQVINPTADHRSPIANHQSKIKNQESSIPLTLLIVLLRVTSYTEANLQVTRSTHVYSHYGT